MPQVLCFLVYFAAFHETPGKIKLNHDPENYAMLFGVRMAAAKASESAVSYRRLWHSRVQYHLHFRAFQGSLASHA